MASIGWNFPSNNNGREDGLNDPGVETFRDDPLRSLSREIPQNSLDAHDGSGKPVEVHFELVDLPISKFPEAEDFERILKACAKYWEANEATKKFLRNASKVVRTPTIRVLKASDYNTTGLLGPVDNRTSDWFKLTKAVGASDKAGGAGGSFGIGKHAPFACSELRTVLYGTRDLTGTFAFQGVSKLVTHMNGKDEPTQGTGYYGIRSKNMPILDPSQVEGPFRRTKVGTDVFVLGFLRDKDWADEIIKGVIESFLVSIHEGRLLVRVDNVLLNGNSLPSLIEKCAAENPDWPARAYYEALTSEEASLLVNEDFGRLGNLEGLGRIEMRLLAGKDYPKRIAMVRSTGMKIYDKGHFQTPLRFAGVFIAKGEKLNALLKSLEPPSHDRWEDKRGDDPGYAREQLKSLYKWISDGVKSLSGMQDPEQLDAEGVSQYLPDDIDMAPSITETTAEGEKIEPLPEISVQLHPHDSPVAVDLATPEPAKAGEGEAMVVEGPGSLGSYGEGGGNGGGGVREGGGGIETTKGASGHGPAPRPKPIGLKKVRVYCIDPAGGRYRIMCEPAESGKGTLLVHVIGEVGQEPAPIREYWLPGASQAKATERVGAIGPLQFENGKRVSVDLVLEGALHCALGVSAHGG
jgi:hypothetical protein